MSMPLALRRNLRALVRTDRRLAERIAWPCGEDHLVQEADGSLALRVHRSRQPVTLPVEQAQQIAASIPREARDELLLIGLGDGGLLLELLRARPDLRVAAWTQDPRLLREVLIRRDWSALIRGRRVRFLLTSDLLDVPALGVRPTVVRHPVLAELHRHGAALLEAPIDAPRALLVTGGLFVDDIADALRDEGYVPVPWDITRWSREELALVAKRARAEVAVAVNYTHGLAEACADLGVPLRVWEIDPATDALRPLDSGAAQGARIYTFRRRQQQQYRAAGFTQVEFLPLAANPERRRPVELAPAELERCGRVAFVGSSMVHQGLGFQERLVAGYTLWRGGGPDAARRECEAALGAVLGEQRRDFSRYRVPELLARALPGFVEAARTRPLLRRILQGASPDVLLGEMAAADKRITYLANLGQVGARVWGDEGWRAAEEYGVRWMGPAGHREELSRIYSSPAIHLDVGRLYQSDIVTMRVFDVLACGGFCLAEWSEGLEDLFEVGVELDCYRNLEEMLEKVEHWLEAGPERRREVGAAGRARVLRDHTIRGRVRRMLAA